MYQGNGLILDGHDIGENLQRDTEFLLSQLRGIENKRIQYIPRLAQVSKMVCGYLEIKWDKQNDILQAVNALKRILRTVILT